MRVFLGYPSESAVRWIKEHTLKPSDALYFQAVNGDASISFSSELWPEGPIKDKDLEWSFDGMNWTKWEYTGTEFTPLNIPSGRKLYMRGNNDDMYDHGPSDSCFKIDGQIEAHGNIMYLLDKTGKQDYVNDSGFENLFNSCSGLLTAPELPATRLGSFAYSHMFYKCSNLIQAPYIPQWERISAQSGSDEFASMFNNCSKLNRIEVGFDNWINDRGDYGNWVNGVSPTGTFECPAALPQTRGINNIPSGWTIVTK